MVDLMYLNNKQNMTMMKPIDDYEISMHEYTIDEAPEEETPTSSKMKQNIYQRIEDWNKDETNGKEVSNVKIDKRHYGLQSLIHWAEIAFDYSRMKMNIRVFIRIAFR